MCTVPEPITVPVMFVTHRRDFERPIPREMLPFAAPPGVALEKVTLLEASDGWVALLHLEGGITATHVVLRRGTRGALPAELLEAQTLLQLESHAAIQGAVIARAVDVWAALAAAPEAVCAE